MLPSRPHRPHGPMAPANNPTVVPEQGDYGITFHVTYFPQLGLYHNSLEVLPLTWSLSDMVSGHSLVQVATSEVSVSTPLHTSNPIQSPDISLGDRYKSQANHTQNTTK